MPTRAEVIHELMDLIKEVKLNAPSKLYKHEAERLLLAMKTMKKIHDDSIPHVRARPGPHGPRPIPTETIANETIEMTIPKPLPKHVSERTKPRESSIKNVENLEISFI